MLDPFRKKALERLSSPEELDRAVRVTRPRTWIALCGLLLVILAVVLWATLTTITTTVSGLGFVLPEGGLIEASSAQEGIVLHIDVTRGEQVRSGEALAVLKTARGTRFAVTAPEAGRVGVVVHEIGDFVPQGGVVVLVQPNHPTVVETFVPEAEAKNARVGQRVWVAPSTASVSEFGYALGTVIEVGNYPLPDPRIESILGNGASARLVSRLGPVIHVVVRLRAAPNPSGVSWTASSGPRGRVTLGTLAQVKIVTGERAPVAYVFG